MAGTVDTEARWITALVAAGHTAETIATRRAALHDFCARTRVAPHQLVSTWQDLPQLTVRRRPRCGEAPNLAVESFLIHNGVNVFGDITCVPSRPQDLAEQGPQFAARTTAIAQAERPAS